MSMTEDDIATDSDLEVPSESYVHNKQNINVISSQSMIYANPPPHDNHCPLIQQAIITDIKPIHNVPNTNNHKYTQQPTSEVLDTTSDSGSDSDYTYPSQSSSTFTRRSLDKLCLDELLAKALTFKPSIRWNMYNQWCRYCGARASTSFLPSPWGPHTLCSLHHTQWKTHKLNLSIHKEPMNIEQAISKQSCTEKQYLIDILLAINTDSVCTRRSQRIKIKKEPYPLSTTNNRYINSLSDFDNMSESESESFYSSCSSYSISSQNESEPLPASTNTVVKIEAISPPSTIMRDTPPLVMDLYNKLFYGAPPKELLSSPVQCVHTTNNIKLEIKSERISANELNETRKRNKRVKKKKKEWMEYLSLPIECTVCGELFASHFQFQLHMKDFHGIKQPYQCMQCPRVKDIRYANKAGLLAHVERDHEMIRPFKCEVCSKAFYRRATLDRHQRVHDGKKPFKCSYCVMRCSQKSSLRQHVLAVHLKQRNYKCKYCGKGFAASTTMKSHAVAKHGDESYARFKCNQCHKKFYIRGHYMKHCQIAHRPRHPVQVMIKNGHCPYIDCNKQYTSKNKAASVKYHLVTKHKDRRYANYECKMCRKLFYDKTSYTQHCDAKHGK